MDFANIRGWAYHKKLAKNNPRRTPGLLSNIFSNTSQISDVVYTGYSIRNGKCQLSFEGDDNRIEVLGDRKKFETGATYNLTVNGGFFGADQIVGISNMRIR